MICIYIYIAFGILWTSLVFWIVDFWARYLWIHGIQYILHNWSKTRRTKTCVCFPCRINKTKQNWWSYPTGFTLGTGSTCNPSGLRKNCLFILSVMNLMSKCNGIGRPHETKSSLWSDPGGRDRSKKAHLKIWRVRNAPLFFGKGGVFSRSECWVISLPYGDPFFCLERIPKLTHNMWAVWNKSLYHSI